MTPGARRQSTSNYCSVTLLTQRVNSLHIELKLIKTVYSASIPLTSLLKTRNSSSSFRGLINALDQEQYHTLTFRDFQSVNEKGDGAGKARWLAGLLTAWAADPPRQVGLFHWHGRDPRGGSTAQPWLGNTVGTGKLVEPWVKARGSWDYASWCKTDQRGHRVKNGAVMGPDLLVAWDRYCRFGSKRHSSLATLFTQKIKK